MIHDFLFIVIYMLEFLMESTVFCSYSCSFTVHTGAGLIIPELQDDGQVNFDYHKLDMLMWLINRCAHQSLFYLFDDGFSNQSTVVSSFKKFN